MKKNILLIISGGIAAFKALEFIRLLRTQGMNVKCILTKGGEQFITPLSVQTLSEQEVYQDLFALTQTSEIEHITLSRQADMVIIYPASADLIAKMATGLADDLASALLLATLPTTPVFVAPAMNVQMWENAATQENIQKLKQRDIVFVGPDQGDMACGEYGFGRLIAPETMINQVKHYFTATKPLSGKTALVTAGPTYEPIDPVRFLGNYSSGRQGYAIAEELHDAGAQVTLISGPVSLLPPQNIRLISVQTAQEMLDACLSNIPVDIAVMTAAVADWRVKNISIKKIKKTGDAQTPTFDLITNPDILATIAQKNINRPKLVIGFAAETNDLLDNADAKRKRKNCDWIVVNDVSPDTKIMGGVENEVTILSSSDKQHFKRADKREIGRLLTKEIIKFFNH
ncbi:bifunctional phosphopantothenoylcysteine decarboxylase/phosphopantothenate--cysteine ligase CoaBC [Commensalibacter papalotli (ex Botero et al. 2024)]|uniref:Coenzyme A biosynthesis bifunctional protein CoaBC n=1 Tax=Commensalibacter papalotli (ex Botero et al. 2024) TaxID=2972766 RepID=A0ABM9HI07_9PROT|nr:bifunctional phosphopantothenoylcysteine decarboxylase/phosphopantothenate--cysteine ligase CoaBC [Commensalibacter papalotli (ex Botero et al. 2024)]CAI3923475.1 Phosphopantothenoylcysteine synthetase/decarboxylase CoaBC (CoaBC) (PDB:3QJG) [Commensalibacter papalotli (ex Botero et al. 2024)]CAI3928644.1 Phosphopantothenoylcysteine synthetase/decarboxylase CoaBC (CoaBC) (PDB:3QJG) [Commensalibacter papalotli (ex Botero et al. 2024)]